MRYKNDKKISNLSSPDSFFFSSSKCTKLRFRPGLCPGPRWGSLQCSPDPLVGWGYTLPIPLPARRLRLELGASVLRPPQHKILATPVATSLLRQYIQLYTAPCILKQPCLKTRASMLHDSTRKSSAKWLFKVIQGYLFRCR